MTGRSWRGFRVLIAFGFRAAPRQAVLFLACGAAMALLVPVSSLGAKLLVDAATAGSLRQGMVTAVALSLTAGIGLATVLYYVDFLFAVVERAGLAADRRLMELMGGVAGLAHHERPEYLDQLQLLREDRSMLAWMTNATAGLLRVVVQLAASAVLLATVQPVLLLLPLFGGVSFLASKRAQDLQMRAREATAEDERRRAHLFTTALSPAAGMELRVFGLADELLRRHHAAADVAIAARNRAEWQGAWWRAVDGLVFGLAYAGAIGLALVRAARGQATPGDVVLTIGLAAGMNGIVATAVGYGSHFLTVLKTARRYVWLEDYARDVALHPVTPAPVPDRLTDGIALRDVSFRYPGMARPILDHLSVHLPAGSVVAVVGENGAGKTSLAKLLGRYYEPDGGELLVDGVPLSRMAVGAWRSRLSAAFQDFARFEFLLGETVGVGDLPAMENTPAVEAALARAGAADLPGELPAGLATPLGAPWPGGVELSGGQWQKLALARGLMRANPLLTIFDEPTAALDAPTEHAIFARLTAAAHANQHAGAVTLLISHRFSTVRMADLIVVLAQGRIVEQGTHADLMQRGGLYAELYTLQSRAYR